MRCGSCGFESPKGFQFCGACGTRLAPSAPASARAWRDRVPQAYTPRHLVERALGSRSALEGERKHLTVLFADVKGSLALAEQLDAEVWRGVMDRFFRILTDAVRQFEGTVNQYTGDGIMALFGAPIAHEHHAERACRAALEIASRLRGFADELRRRHGLVFAVRIGLHSGEVVVGGIGDDLRTEYTAQGHVVGLASRIERLAEPGHIWITEATARLIGDRFRLRRLGHRDVAGASGGVVVFELEGEAHAHRPSFDRGEGRFVGRSNALQSLETALRRALDGDGLVLGVEGAPGVGKSRLCREFVRRCQRRGLRVAEAHCPAHGRMLPLAAMFDLLRSFFFGEETLENAAARSRIEEHCAGLSASSPVALADLLEGLGLAEPSPARRPGDADERLQGLAVSAIRARAEHEPTVLLIDDLHWIDAPSEAFVGQLVECGVGTQALLVLNYRSDHRAPWMEYRSFHQLGLPPLGPKECMQLVRERVGSDPSTRALPGLVYERVGGNPLFLEESLRALLESGRLVGDPGAYVWNDPAQDLGIPATVHTVIAARIDRLTERHKLVLQAASVIGKRFEAPILAQVAEVDAERLDTLLRELEEAEFVRRGGPYQPGECAFKHPLTQEVAYASLLSKRRAELHESVAEALAQSGDRLGARADLIAHHWDAANRPRDARLWRYRTAYQVTNIVPRRSWEERNPGR